MLEHQLEQCCCKKTRLCPVSTAAVFCIDAVMVHTARAESRRFHNCLVKRVETEDSAGARYITTRQMLTFADLLNRAGYHRTKHANLQY